MVQQIIILSESASFPWGMAAANRVRNLAKGFSQEGWQVEYIGLRGADADKKKDSLYPFTGKTDGIRFNYPGMIPVRPKNWWLRRVDDIFGFCFTTALLLWRRITGKVDAVLLYTQNSNYAGFLIPFLHLLKIPVILEVCEWPLAVAEGCGEGQKKAEVFCKKIVPTVDGVLPISSYIEREIKKVASLKRKIIPSFKIPILIDVVETENPMLKHGRYMLYCGSISYMDIARLVVDIVFELRSMDIQLPVKFTGKKNNTLFTELKNYAEQKGVLDLFEFTGFVDEQKLYSLMRRATCLLAPLPENIQSVSRFSTKIGYYLASGTPVVINMIGDVSLYLQNGVNAFVAEQCEPKQFAVKIKEIIFSPDFAKNIGSAGRVLAFETFHYSRACKGMGEFITQVVQDYRTK